MIPDLFAETAHRIRERIRDTGTASLALAVAQNGKILYEAGFGWANRETRHPATAHTLYSLASISKPITATALMVLFGMNEGIGIVFLHILMTNL